MCQIYSREIGRMFGFGIDTNPLAGFRLMPLEQFQNSPRNVGTGYLSSCAVLASRSSGSRSRANSVFSSASVKVLGKPAFKFPAINSLAGLAISKFRPVRDIRCLADLVLVPRDQYPVFGQHQIRLDKVRPLRNRQFIGRQSMFRSFAAGTAMGNDDRGFASSGLACCFGHLRICSTTAEHQCQRDEPRPAGAHQTDTSTPFQNAIRSRISAAASFGSG